MVKQLPTEVINMHNSFSFEIFDGALRRAGSCIGAAEMHGLQSGLICGEKIAGTFNWEAVLIQELNCLRPSSELLKHLNYLYARTVYQLHGIDFQFDLLLPTDKDSLIKRAKALADWCRGFICGLGLAGIQNNSISSKMAKEAIKDLSQIAHVDVGDEELLEEQEKAFFELVEYVRVAVQTIQIDLQVGKQSTVAEYVLH